MLGAVALKLNHVNLTVSDVAAARQFLEKYFGLQGSTNPHTGESPAGDNENRNFAVLFDDAGLVLTLMKSPKGAPVEYPATFHIGFIQPSDQHVNDLNRRMRADGLDVPPPQRSHAWTYYVTAPGGFVVEVLS